MEIKKSEEELEEKIAYTESTSQSYIGETENILNEISNESSGTLETINSNISVKKEQTDEYYLKMDKNMNDLSNDILHFVSNLKV
jgi:hypothetical protein